LETAASSALQAASSEEKSDIAALTAPSVRNDCHWSLRRLANAGEVDCRLVM